jgi:LuxR family maltose regulon positive regulatory protein
MTGSESGIIRTKLSIPLLQRTIFPREKLLQKMKMIPEYDITVISAPAGYGKTTAAAVYAAGSGQKTAWFSIDESDDDPVQFWQYAVAALSAAGPAHAASFQDLAISREIIENNIIAKLLLERMCGIPDDTLFVMDDFHLIGNPAILGSMKYMARYLPRNFKILITSRRELDEGLAVQLSRGKVLCLDAGDLAFDTEEISEFYEKRGIILNSREISRIFDSTEGWVAGLVLSSIASSRKEIVREATLYHRGNRQINRFLSDEVFFKWPERVRRFLIRTSVLDRFSAPLCRAVTGMSDSEEIIGLLSESNSFMVALDNTGGWYRYHHLFSEFLKTKLAAEDAQAVVSLYHGAGQWYAANGFPQEAIEALIRGEDYTGALNLFWTVFLPMAGRGALATLLGWLERIPAEVHKNAASYCFIYAYLLDMENRTVQADDWYARGLSAFDSKNYHMFPMRDDGMDMKLLILCKSGFAARKMDLEEIAACYREAAGLNLPTAEHGETNAYQPSLLKTQYNFYGRMKLLEETYLPIYDDLTKCHGKTMAYIKVLQAEGLYERDLLDDARQLLLESLESVLELNYSGATVPYFFTLAKVCRARGDLPGAFEAVTECRKRLGHASALWGYIVDVFEAGLYLEQGDTTAGERLVRFSRMDAFDEISATSEFELQAYATYLMLTGSPDKAAALLNRLASFAEKENRHYSRIEILCLLSAAYSQDNMMDRAVAALDDALALGMEDGYVRPFLDEKRLTKVLSRYINAKRKTGPAPRLAYAKRLYQLAVNRSPAAAAPRGENGPLSRQERQVLKLMAAGCSNLEIAGELGISENTVKYHSKNIYSKLDVKNRQNAINKARDMGL